LRLCAVAITQWDRDKALGAVLSVPFRLLVHGEGERATDPLAAIRKSYERGVTDEFVEPIVITKR
jgi:2,3-bisphosphoglycerate-independent phosphoglycerate mutase